MKHWLPRIRELHVQTFEEEQLETLSETPRVFIIHDLTLKCDHYITSQTMKLLHACRSLRYLHIERGVWASENGRAMTLVSLTELILSSSFPLFRLYTPSITCLTISGGVWLQDRSYSCLKRLSITSDDIHDLCKHLHVPPLDYLFLDSLNVSHNERRIEISKGTGKSATFRVPNRCKMLFA